MLFDNDHYDHYCIYRMGDFFMTIYPLNVLNYDYLTYNLYKQVQFKYV